MKKQIQQTTLSLGLLFGLASPSIATAWNIKAESAARNTLASQLKNPSSQMMQVKSPSADNILDAVKKVGGKATVQMGNGNSMKIDIQEKANGGSVIVGSGADELVATSNSSGGSGTVVISPPPMTTSITVVIPDEDLKYQHEEVYLIKIPNNLLETDDPYFYKNQLEAKVRPYDYLSLKGNAWMLNVNKPFRTNSGKYLLVQSASRFGYGDLFSSDSIISSIQIIDLKEGENAITFLHKVEIEPAFNATKAFAYFRKKLKNKSEQNIAYFIYDAFNLEEFSVGKSSDFCKENGYLQDEYFFNRNTRKYEFDSMRLKVFDVTSSKKVFFLFPSSYDILWYIDDSCSVGQKIDIE